MFLKRSFMKYNFQLYFVILITIFMCKNTWALDSTKVTIPATAKPMTYAAPITPTTVTVDLSSNSAPLDVICPDGYTLVALKYTDASGQFEENKLYQPSGGTPTC